MLEMIAEIHMKQATFCRIAKTVESLAKPH